MLNDLLKHVSNKDFLAAKDIVESILREKISSKLQEQRIVVADKTFNTKEKSSIDESVKVSSASKDNYQWANGKKPSGHGRWMFSTIQAQKHNPRDAEHMKQTYTSSYSSFGDASKEAAKHFRDAGHDGEIHVLS